MTDRLLDEIAHLLDPPAGRRLWYGGASPSGALRGVSPAAAFWKPSPDRHSIWDLTLHLAYWKYAVRRLLQDAPRGSFPRSPSNWPAPPDTPDAAAWQADRALLKSEHRLLADVVRDFDPDRLDDPAAGSKTYRYADLMFGVVTHDVYHVGQIQILKRLYTATGRRT